MESIKCPACGLYNYAPAEVCKRCGLLLTAPPPPDRLRPPAPHYAARHERTSLRWMTNGIFYSCILAILLAPGVFLVNLVSHLLRNTQEQNWETDFAAAQVAKLFSTYLLVLLIGLAVLWSICYLRRHNDE
jgi:rRNA maturation protein Nop10